MYLKWRLQEAFTIIKGVFLIGPTGTYRAWKFVHVRRKAGETTFWTHIARTGGKITSKGPTITIEDYPGETNAL